MCLIDLFSHCFHIYHHWVPNCSLSIYNSSLSFLFQVSITNTFVPNTSDLGLSVLSGIPPTPGVTLTQTGQNAMVCWNRLGVTTPQTFPSSTRLCPLSCSSQQANIPWRSACSRKGNKRFYSLELMAVWLAECTLEPKDPPPPLKSSARVGSLLRY